MIYLCRSMKSCPLQMLFSSITLTSMVLVHISLSNVSVTSSIGTDIYEPNIEYSAVLFGCAVGRMVSMSNINNTQ